MIKIKTDQNNGKVISAKFTYNDTEISIPADILFVKKENTENIGYIMESYREKVRLNSEDSQQYFDIHKQLLIDNIDVKYWDRDKNIPESLFIFQPIDKNRSELLHLFKESILKNKYEADIDDLSMYYQKKDKTKSIKGGLKKDDFVLTLEKNKLLKSILVIDDIIDKGDTLNFFLEHMVDNGNVDNQTNITFCGIYCNDRIENKLTLEKIREIMKKPSH